MSQHSDRYDDVVFRWAKCALTRKGFDGAEALNNMRGVYPIESYRVFKNICADFDVDPSDGIGAPSLSVCPELHPLDYEWYFTEKTAKAIAADISSKSNEVACLGAPTVASALGQLGRSATLIDNNPLVRNRIQNSSSIKFFRHDLNDPLDKREQFDGVFFDAPWYPEYIQYWLWQSVRIVKKGGVVMFSLFPPLTRPSAQSERRSILHLSRSLGQIDMRRNALTYSTPRYEQEAFEHEGLPRLPQWRKADLVIIRIENPYEGTLPRPRSGDDKWVSYLFGEQVIKLRSRVAGSGDGLFMPVPEYPDYVATSVSRRDPARERIEVWTSRNRVAQVGDLESVKKVLASLQQDASVIQAVRNACPGLESDKIDRYTAQVCKFLNLSNENCSAITGGHHD